jgi:hypothetical protein
VQVDLFEEAMSDDYESMLDRFGAETLLKKLDKYKLELGLGQNYLMVMTSSLSQTSLDFLPFDPAKTTGMECPKTAGLTRFDPTVVDSFFFVSQWRT